MSKGKKPVSKEKRRFSNRQLILLSIILMSAIIMAFIVSFVYLQTPNRFSLKAAIIDQIGESYPSDSEMARQFNETSTSLLENATSSVSYYKPKSVTVDFLKGLAKYDYGIIILRAHFAMRADETTVDLFTSEEYRGGVYSDVSNGSLSWEPSKFYFAVTPNFIKNLEGSFPRSIVIAMGCWSLKPNYEEMADAFIKKGATAYIGWTEEVDIGHSDNETIRLLKMLLEENRTVADAVGNVAPDRTFLLESQMGFYPQTDVVGNLKIADLIAEAKVSLSLQGAVAFLGGMPAPWVKNLILIRIEKKSRFDLSTTLSALRPLHTAGREESSP
jgi:hypothetical protein